MTCFSQRFTSQKLKNHTLMYQITCFETLEISLGTVVRYALDVCDINVKKNSFKLDD